MTEPLGYFEVRNWDTFQHYRDRRPSWIKVYNALQDDYQFTALPDAQKGQLIGIWLLASRLGNRIPWDERWVGAQIHATDALKLDLLLSGGFIRKISLVAGSEHRAPDLFHNGSDLASLEREGEVETEGERHTQGAPKGGAFARWWVEYPKKVKKIEAQKVWKAKGLDALVDQLIADVKTRRDEDDRWVRGYAPDPPTYLRNERWNDEISQPQPGKRP